jgi:hypothetical protein
MTKATLAFALVFCLSLFSCRLLNGQLSRGNNYAIASFTVKRVLSGKPSSLNTYYIRLRIEPAERSNSAFMVVFAEGVQDQMKSENNGFYSLQTDHKLDQKSALRFYFKGSKDTLRIEPPLPIQLELRQ